MPKKKDKRSAAARDIAAENFDMGCRILGMHPMFSPLLYRAYVLRREGNLCPKDGWAVVTSRGHIHAHPTRRGDPDEWVYVLAHCLLHLGFGHFSLPSLPGGELEGGTVTREWNAACDCMVDDFLGKLKLGRPPHDFIQPMEH